MAYEVFAVGVGRGKLALTPVPGGAGDLRADVEAISQWGTTMVVSATEVEEMQSLGAARLPDLLREAGIEWAHFPIRDFAVPESPVAPQWAALSQSIHQHLQAEGGVLVHCRGGCGRSGMLVLRVMVEAGTAAKDALAQLRAVRPCAVETDAQMGWATKGLLTQA